MARFARKMKRSFWGSSLKEALDSSFSVTEYKDSMWRQYKKDRAYEEAQKYKRLNYTSSSFSSSPAELISIASGESSTDDKINDSSEDKNENKEESRTPCL